MIELITENLKAAMKSKNKAKITGLRNLIGKLKAKQIDKGEPLTEEESLKILSNASKQLKDSIKQYSDADRLDLVEKENYELSLVQQYLPEPISENKVKEIIIKIINDNNASSMADMGKIMGIAMSQLSSAVDGNIVQKIVREQLNK